MYDWCRANRGGTGLDFPDAFERMARALAATGRPMIYSISEYGRSKPWEWAAEYGHLWRTTPDIAPNWRSVMRLTDRQHGLASWAGPGGWNDPDMLEVGNPGLSDIEARSQFMLWILLAAPLMAGNDLRTMTETTRALLTHPGLLAISQDAAGHQGSRSARWGRVDVWRRDLRDGHVTGVLNRGIRPLSLAHRNSLIVDESGRMLATTGADPVNVWSGRPIEANEQLGELEPHEMLLVRSFGTIDPNPRV